MIFKNFILLFLVGYLFKPTELSKLNYPRVLLPLFDRLSINFTLEVIEKGCFKWMSSRQDLIQIFPQYENNDSDCSSKAKISVLTKEKKRSTAIVLAEDLATSEILRCDVILDVIGELGILTTTRELFLEEAPETFEIWAQDSQGNAFTTLEGVEFQWQIIQSDGNWPQVLRFLTFSESKYHEVPNSLSKFESLGIQGHMVLLEAINTGTAKVSVRLPYSEYNAVPIIEVDIMVLANIILDPIDVNILIGDTIEFRILQLKQGKLHEISINNQYFLEILDTNVASMNQNLVTGITIGKTAVVLRDRNVLNDMQHISENKSPVPRASLTVTTAYKMTVNLLPYYNWVTVEGEKHEIAIDLYTRDDKPIMLGPKYYISSDFDETLFYSGKMSKNGSRIYGQTLKEGSCLVHASYNQLSAKAELQIYKELTLLPKFIILPYDSNAPKSQKIQFVAKGGDGSLMWSSSSPNLLSINQNGLAETKFEYDERFSNEENYDDKLKSKLIKHTNIKVSMSRNPKISRIANIFLLPPVKIEIIKYNFETSLKDYVKLQIGLFAYTNGSNTPFTKCDNLHFELEFSNPIFQTDLLAGTSKHHISDDWEPNACHIIYLKSLETGQTNLKLIYRFMDKIFFDEVQLYVFEPLSIMNPEINEIVLPIGTSRDIIYNNGPARIFSLEAELTKLMNYSTSVAEVVEINTDTSKSLYVLRILCKTVGETDLDVKIFNSLLVKNCAPYISNVVTNIHCVKPRFINLYPTEKVRENCPFDMKKSIMHIKNQEEDNLEIEIEILDKKNRKLMNISSLIIHWELQWNDGNTAHSKEISFKQETEEELIESIRIPSKDFIKTTIRDIPHNFKVKSTVISYNINVLQKYKITPENPEFSLKNLKSGILYKPKIENEINFMTVNISLLPFDNISILLTKNRVERIPISQGSGYYEFIVSDNGVLNAEFDDKNNYLIIKPLKIGHVVIELVDRCLLSESSKLTVSIVSVGRIAVDVQERVQKGKTIEAIIKLYDSNENLFDIDPFNLFHYQLHQHVFNPILLNVKLSEIQNDLQRGEIRYLVTGNELGETKIIFSSGYEKQLISSEAVSIQIFPPLKLYPKNSTIVIGSSIQIYYRGGPSPDVDVIYSIQNPYIISIDSSLVLGTNLGKTKITGKCVGINSASGKQIIFSEDTIEIFVVLLEKIQIRTPLLKIKSGAVMPAFVWGVPELSPMILGTLHNMRIIWSTNQPDVVDIYNVFTETGIEYNDHDLISVRIKALNPGKAKIQANVILADGKKITAFVEIIVFKILELDSPKSIKTDSILIAPHSTLQLKANLDDVTYAINGFPNPSTSNFISKNRTNVNYLTENNSNNIIKVSSDGYIQSGEILGRALIIAKTYEQTLPIDVEVKNIQYILTSLKNPSVKLTQTEEKIPRGMNFVLKISLHDNLGNEFSHNIEVMNAIKYDLSHKDMVDIQSGNNHTFSGLLKLINLLRKTNNMLAIILKDAVGIKYAEDFIKLSVAESKNVFPTSNIFSFGDVICFKSPLTKKTSWTTSDETLIKIDSTTGVAKVIGSQNKFGGKVSIENKGLTGNFIKYDLEIRDADQIEFQKEYDILSGTRYEGYLVIRNHLQTEKFSNLFAKNISMCLNHFNHMLADVNLFTCRLSSQLQSDIQILDIFKVTPKFDINKGMYLCEIQLVDGISDILNIIKNNDVNIDLEAQLPNGISDIITLKVVPAVKVSPEAFYVDQISNQGLIISGLDKVLQKVEVKSSDQEVLEILPQAKAHGSLYYKLKLFNPISNDKNLFINIISPLTLQNLEIPILKTDITIPICSNQPFKTTPIFVMNLISNLGFIISILVFMGTTIWVVVFGFPGRNQNNINKEVFSTSLKDRTNTANITGYSTEESQLNKTSGGSRLYYSHFDSSFKVDGGNLCSTNGNNVPVYGDTSITSPQRRLHPRIL